MPKTDAHSHCLGLDVGSRRIGVALADTAVMIAHPLTAIEMSDTAPQQIAALAEQYRCSALVVGYPRNQSGDPTAQTAYVEAFVDRLKYATACDIVYQDESLTSVIAEERLMQRGKRYSREDIDTEAACIILTDYLEVHHG